MTHGRKLFAAAIAGALAIAAPSYAAASPFVPATSDYTPQYYMGYLVFFEADGTPFYFANGVRYYVPGCLADHALLVRHYRLHARGYRRWLGIGWRYRLYRRPYTAPDFVPMCYGSHTVYYDDLGHPFYYMNGAVHYVPRSYRWYSRLLGHYRRHQARYRNWHRRQAPRRVRGPVRHNRTQRFGTTSRAARSPVRSAPVRRQPAMRRSELRSRASWGSNRFNRASNRRAVSPGRPARRPVFRPTPPASRSSNRTFSRGFNSPSSNRGFNNRSFNRGFNNRSFNRGLNNRSFNRGFSSRSTSRNARRGSSGQSQSAGSNSRKGRRR